MNKKKAGIACVLPDWRKPAYLTHKIKKRCNFQKSLRIIYPCAGQWRRLRGSGTEKVDIRHHYQKLLYGRSGRKMQVIRLVRE